MVLLSGNTIALHLQKRSAFLFGHIRALLHLNLVRNVVSLLPWNIYAGLFWNTSALLIWNIVTLLSGKTDLGTFLHCCLGTFVHSCLAILDCHKDFQMAQSRMEWYDIAVQEHCDPVVWEHFCITLIEKICILCGHIRALLHSNLVRNVVSLLPWNISACLSWNISACLILRRILNLEPPLQNHYFCHKSSHMFQSRKLLQRQFCKPAHLHCCIVVHLPILIGLRPLHFNYSVALLSCARNSLQFLDIFTSLYIDCVTLLLIYSMTVLHFCSCTVLHCCSFTNFNWFTSSPFQLQFCTPVLCQELISAPVLYYTAVYFPILVLFLHCSAILVSQQL